MTDQRGVDGSDAFPTPFERRLRETGVEIAPDYSFADEVGAIAAVVEAAGEPRHERVPTPPPNPAHRVVVGAKRYCWSWVCYPCTTTFGTEEDQGENIVPPDCPVCGRRTERQSVVDRQADAPPRY
jgi:hypothetical protein